MAVLSLAAAGGLGCAADDAARTAAAPNPSAGPSTALTAERRAALEAEVLALDDRWADAAMRGAPEDALACFAGGPRFSFAYDGGLIRSFTDYSFLVRESYAQRKSLRSEKLQRQVSIIDETTAAVSSRTRFVVESLGGIVTSTIHHLGFLAQRGAEGWRIVHCYEFLSQQNPN